MEWWSSNQQKNLQVEWFWFFHNIVMGVVGIASLFYIAFRFSIFCFFTSRYSCFNLVSLFTKETTVAAIFENAISQK